MRGSPSLPGQASGQRKVDGGGRWVASLTFVELLPAEQAGFYSSSALTGPLTPGRPLLPHLIFLIYKMIIMLPPAPATATQWGINK